MHLVNPTDFEILRALADGKRNNAANLSVKLDKDRAYLNTRLLELENYDLLEKVGPSPNSGLYVITERGQTALQLRNQYSNTDNFETLLNKHTPSTDTASSTNHR